jgi:hypothetical protein
MAKFYCSECNLEFESDKPERKEYTDYFLGPCSKNVANCPECKKEAGEKLIPKPQKRSIPYPQNSCTGDCRNCG